MASARKRVAIFGGSFDPVHLGHLEMVRLVQDRLSLDEVIFMPCFVSPFKSGTVATAEQRVEMLELGIDEFGLKSASVSWFEVEREQSSYSWETAQHFTEREPETEWHWILGTDQWSSIERWAEPEKLRQLLHFIVLTRNGDEVVARDDWRYDEISFAHPASSTAIRKDFDSHREWLPRSVRLFCESAELYGS